jgi:hypothetical protein
VLSQSTGTTSVGRLEFKTWFGAPWHGPVEQVGADEAQQPGVPSQRLASTIISAMTFGADGGLEAGLTPARMERHDFPFHVGGSPSLRLRNAVDVRHMRLVCQRSAYPRIRLGFPRRGGLFQATSLARMFAFCSDATAARRLAISTKVDLPHFSSTIRPGLPSGQAARR